MSEPTPVEWRLIRDDPIQGRDYFAMHRGIRYFVSLDPADGEDENRGWVLGVSVADQLIETLLYEESEYEALGPAVYPNPDAALEAAARWIEGVSKQYYDLRRQAPGWPGT